MHSFSLYEWLHSEKIVQNISFPPWLPTVKEKREKPTKTKPKKNLPKFILSLLFAMA